MMATDNQNLVEVEATAMRDYLLSIGFKPIAEVGHSLAFRHPDSEVVLAITNGSGSELIRPADFLSIKFRLESAGLISDEALAELNQGRLPIAS